MKPDIKINVEIKKNILYYIGFPIAWIGDKILGLGILILSKSITTKVK